LITHKIQYQDHHQYSDHDCAMFLDLLKTGTAECFVTTRKDWYKIAERLHNAPQFDTLPFYVLDIEFAFLSDEQSTRFFSIMHHVLK